MKGVIIFKGKYGATLQYAKWLSAALRLPLLPPEKADEIALAKNDFVIIGSSVYVGKLLVYNWLKMHARQLQGKKVFLFIVCATPATEKEKLETIRQQNIPPALLQTCTVYFLHGRLEKEKLSWPDLLMLKIGAMLQKEPAAKKTMLQDFDDVRKENLVFLEKDILEFTSKTAYKETSNYI